MRGRNLGRMAMWGGAVLFLTGCSRQDADVLARIGQNLWDRAQSVNVTDTTNKLARSMPLPRSGDGDELERRVESRLRADPALTSLRVRTEGGQIKLCGRVRDEDERKRALSLAEEAAGAGKVIDGLEGPTPP